MMDGGSDGFHSPVSSPESFYSSSFASTPSPSHGFDHFLPKMKDKPFEPSTKCFNLLDMDRIVVVENSGVAGLDAKVIHTTFD